MKKRATCRIRAVPEFDTSRSKVSLDGTWRFSYDPDEMGVKERWFEPGRKLPEEIEIPGCSQVRRYSSAQGAVRNTDVEIPEHSQTIMLKHGSMSPSWCKRSFDIPSSWAGSRVHLRVGGVKPAGEFWVNGHHLGETRTSRSPVAADVTDLVNFGGKNCLAVRISWPRVRLEGVFDIWHAWSGLYRHVWIEKRPEVSIEDVHVVPCISPSSATIRVTLLGSIPSNCGVELKVSPLSKGRSYSSRAAVQRNGTAEVRIPMPGAKLWSVSSPELYRVHVVLKVDDREVDTAAVRFGLREVTTTGSTVCLNGTPIFLRGACDDRIYPETVCPPADKGYYRSQILKAKKLGFNYTKSAIEVFTREYLEAADELGYLVCQEMPFGAVGELREIRQEPPQEFVRFWKNELSNIVQSDRNHPSVIVYSLAGELLLNAESPTAFNIFSKELPPIARRFNPKALVIDITAPFCYTAKIRHGVRDTDMLEEWIDDAFCISPLHGQLKIPASVDRPFILHEWNWITHLPDPALIKQLKATPLVPVQIPEMVQLARENNQESELKAMVEASRKLRHVLRKSALERAFENPKVAGYHHWLIHDVPYCPEGVLDVFWKTPAGLDASEFRRYNSDTVIVLEDNPTRSFCYGSAVPFNVVLAHFGEASLSKAEICWKLMSGNRVHARGSRKLPEVRTGSRKRIAGLEIPPLNGDKPRRCELVVELREGRKQVTTNSWPLWFFPSQVQHVAPQGTYASLPWIYTSFPGVMKPMDPLAPPKDAKVFVTGRLTDASGGFIPGLGSFMENGGRLLLVTNGELKESESCFYRTVPFNFGRKGNMGTLIHQHPAFGDFPHEGWCDLPFVPMIEGAYAVDLSAFKPAVIRPIIRGIGHHVTMEDKAYMFEVGVGRGTLLACSFNMDTGVSDPSGRYLMSQMIAYLSEGRRISATSISLDVLKQALK